MMLMAWYVLFMVIGDLVAYGIGLLVEYEWGSEASLIVFLALYFISLWVAYLLSVWATKPTEVPATKPILKSRPEAN